MRTFTIVAMAFLFVFVSMPRIAQADEVKAKMEEMTGEAKAKAQEAKGEVKALTEEAKGNKVKGAVERAKGKTKQPESGSKARRKK